MSAANTRTLAAYDTHARAYVDGTPQGVDGPVKVWIDGVLADLERGARVLELGSAFGRDAAYMAARGVAVECTDAAPAFVALLRERGFAARRLDAVRDPLDGPYDMVFANAVLLHFERTECARVLDKVRRALAPGGRFAFSLKQGDGEEWSTAKLGVPRFFCYWRAETLEPALRAAGFVGWTLSETARAGWLYGVARV